MPDEHLQGEPQHKMVLTGKGKDGDVLRVRCKCMAEYRNVSDRYYNYDYIAEVTDLDAAREVYDRHLEGR
jgi:hypothetical protein